MALDLDEILPKSIKVGYSYYQIEIQDQAWMDANNAYGDQHGHKKVINVCDSWELPEVQDTLTHEIKHAIHEFFNLPSKCTEEQYVHVQATGWTMVWMDNPELRKFFNYVADGEAYG